MRPRATDAVFSTTTSLICALLLAAAGQVRMNAQGSNVSVANPQQPRAERGRQFLGLGPAADQAAAGRGQKLFVQACGFCHGANATGAEGPDLLRSTVVLHDDKGELIGPMILKGRPDKGMPSFTGMAEAQIYDIAEFLHARVEAAANRFGYKMQNVVTGNATAGEAFFKGAGQCNTCHSVAGDLAHIAKKFEPADLQAQFLYPSQSLSSDEVRRGSPSIPALITLSSGERVAGKLKRLDDFEVSMYDSSGVYHCWPRTQVKVEVSDPLQKHRELLDKYTDADMHNLLSYLVTLK